MTQELNQENVIVSVIIPIYNAEKYIERCVDSILQQTVNNIEVICVDDGSKDASAKICEAIAQKDSRLKVIRQQNGGSSKARNRGLQEARGEWISFVDADDWIAPDMLEQLLNGAISKEIDIVICNHYQVHESGKQRISPSFGENQIWDRTRIDIELRKFLCKGVKEYRPYVRIGAPWARIYRRNVIIGNNILFPENVARTEDGIFNMYTFENSRMIAYVDMPLYFYRVLEGSISHKMYPRIVKNTEEDFKEVQKFADRYKQMDEMFLKGVDARICTWFYKYLDCLYFQPTRLKKVGFLKTREEILALLKEPLYREAYNKVDVSLLNYEQRVFVQMIKWHWIGGLYLMVSVRKGIKQIKAK